MSSSAQTALIFFSYALVILGAFYWSGQVTEKTIYDRYIVSLEGTLLRVSSEERALKFYRDVLEFTPLPQKSVFQKFVFDDSHLYGFILPGKRKIYLQLANDDMPPQTTVVFKVRNGLKRLHENFQKKLGSKTHQLTDLSKKTWGREFTVSDPDGNKLIFYKPNLIKNPNPR